MNSPPLAPANLTTLPNRETSLAPRDVADRGDLYSSWRAIFERAHAVEEPREQAAGRSQNSGATPGSCVRENAAVPVVVTADAGAVRLTASRPSSQVASGAHFVRGTPRGLVSSADSAGLAVSYVARVSGTVSEKINPLRALTPSQLAEALPATAESVVVSIEGASVAIAVRDATLSDEHALHTGFEAARKLSGRSAALRQLTLNGRTIYQQHVDASSQGAERLDAPLLFGC